MQQQLGKRKRREESGITEKPDSDLLCFICNSIIQNAASVPCGHSYCRSCIVLHIESTPSCPQCSHPLSLNEIFPNLLLQKLIQRSNPSLKPTFSIQSHVNYELLLKFLRISKDKKLSELNSLNSQLEILDTDIGMVSTRLNTARKAANENKTPKETSVPENKVDVIKIEPSVPAVVNDDRITVLVDKQYNRINQHFNDLQDYYFSLHKDTDQVQRSGIEFSDTFSKFSKYSRIKTLANLHYADSFFNGSNSIVSSIEFDKDDEFFATAGVTRKIKIFNYANVVVDYRQTMSTGFVSALDRDRDQDTESEDSESEGESEASAEANGGALIVEDHAPGAGDGVARFPAQEIVHRSKISCLSWNSHVKNHLLSSDYEGVVSLWDSEVGSLIHNYNEHEKRAWSVDFSVVDTHTFASGGDDTKVKLWSTQLKNSIATIPTKANICSVRFNPKTANQIAFGSADHHTHIYDIRNVATPLSIIKGHRKAVSYCRYLSKDTIVSASTDCSLRLWDIKKSFPTTQSIQDPLIKTYTGHLNEKNFVGLTVNSDNEYIACGSENNQVYVYFSKLPKPLAVFSFGNPIDAITGRVMQEEDPTQFVSNVCFKRKTPNVLVAANSQGRIKVLEMC